MNGSTVSAFALPVESLGDPLTGIPTVAKCGSALFYMELKPPSAQMKKKLDTVSGSGSGASDVAVKAMEKPKETETEITGDSNSPAEPAHGGYGDDLLQDGLNELLEAAEESEQNGGNENENEDAGEASFALFVQSAVQQSWEEGMSSNFASAVDEVEEELDAFIQQDAEAQAPVTRAEDKLFAASASSSSSKGLEPSRVNALAAEFEVDCDLLPEEAFKEATLNSSAGLGTIDLSNPDNNTAESERLEPEADHDSVTSVLDRIVVSWLESLQKSLACLVEQNKAVLEQRCGGRESAGVSIVELPPLNDQGPRVVLVEWTMPGRSGRIIDLDPDGNLVPLVCVGSKQHPTNFESLNANVLVPATGVTYTRDKRKGMFGVKNRLPEHWSRVMEIWTAAHSRLFADDILEDVGDDDTAEPCVLCSATEVEQHEPEQACLCPLCLIPSHKACAQKVLEFGLSSLSSAKSTACSAGDIDIGPIPPANFQLPQPVFSDTRPGQVS